MVEGESKIGLVIFDWAGTTVDFGSRAPAAAFAQVFSARRVEVSDVEARTPMGLNKREHLVAMLSSPEIAARWQKIHGRPWSEADVDAMYEAFVPFQLKAIEQTSELVPRLLEVIADLRSRNIKIGGTTGYFRAAADAVAKRAAEAGFTPDANACADDVPQGRPAPWMIYRLMEKLGVYPASSVLKIGDTVADVEAGLNAGCWSVGVCDSSSLTGLSRPEFERLDDAQRRELLAQTAKTFQDHGSHAVIESMQELPGLIDQLNARLAAGERPGVGGAALQGVAAS